MERITRPTLGITLALLFVLCGGFVRPACASVVYVNKNAPGIVHDGKTWATAFTAIQPAIDSAISGDEVWVAAATYVENITVKARVSMYGEYTGTETSSDQRNWQANVTVLDGGGSTTAAVVRSSVQGTSIDGFSVRNCHDGLFVFSSATITNCTISGNTNGINFYGGVAIVSNCIISGNENGVYGEFGRAGITECTIKGNKYGIYTFFSPTTVANCAVTANSSAGVYARVSNVDVRDCTISENRGRGIDARGTANVTNCKIIGNGIGVYGDSSTAKVENCTISQSGYGVYVDLRFDVTFTNCVIAFNAHGVYRLDTINSVALTNCDVYGNTYYDDNTDFANINDPTGMFGNISGDPMFVNRNSGDYHLQPNSPCIDAGDDSVVIPDSTDFDGRFRLCGEHVDMGPFEWQNRDPWSARLGTAVLGGVTVADSVVYTAGIDGILYARRTSNGGAIPGFPVDISAAVGAAVKLPSRPAVYYGKTGKAIYLTTDRGDIVRVLPNGTVAWHVRPLAGQTVSTPAVTPDGNVFVNLSTGSGPFNNFVFKLDEATGTPLSLSPFLGYTNASDLGDSSPAANNRYLYVNSGWGSGNGLTLLNQDNLAVRSSFAGGEKCLPPMLVGNDLILASKGGKAWKMNAVTLNPDFGFGRLGVADIGAPISAAPFSDAAGNVYLGTADGRILKWTPGSGSFQAFYTTTGRIAGLTINRSAGVLAFGTSSGAFLQVPLDNPTAATTVTPGGAISTGTVYEALTDRFIVATDGGVLCGYPSIR